MQVNELRTVVAEGRYEVDSSKVAEAIVDKLRSIISAREVMLRATDRSSGVDRSSGPFRTA